MLRAFFAKEFFENLDLRLLVWHSFNHAWCYEDATRNNNMRLSDGEILSESHGAGILPEQRNRRRRPFKVDGL